MISARNDELLETGLEEKDHSHNYVIPKSRNGIIAQPFSVD